MFNNALAVLSMAIHCSENGSALPTVVLISMSLHFHGPSSAQIKVL